MKKKLNINQQINHMKIINGIKFNIMTEDEAIEFLKYNNYFFKIKCFAKNFDKYKYGENKNKYINLEFAYLVELSRLDRSFRFFINKITLDIEHFAKTELINDFSKNNLEDGYEIIKEFLNQNEYIKKYFKNEKRFESSFNKDLIIKHRNNLAIWNFVEIISFGDFIKLYEFYYKKYPKKESMINFLTSVKHMRNASSHNNCLLNSINQPYKVIRKTKNLNTILSKIKTIKTKQRKEKLKNPLIHDFLTCVYAYYHYSENSSLKYDTFDELKNLIDARFTKNKEFFKNNQGLISSYNFVKNVVDYFYYQVYNQ